MSDHPITEMPLGILTDSAIASIANAVFATPGAEVLEAYSDFGTISRRLDSVDDLSTTSTTSFLSRREWLTSLSSILTRLAVR